MIISEYYNGKPWKNRNLSDKERYNLRYKLDAEFQAKERLRNQLSKQKKLTKIADNLRSAVNRNGDSNKVESILGFTVKQFMKHFESKFKEGMNWEKFNSGEIHIDHIRPKSWYNYSSYHDEEFKECWSLDNLQPLWAEENLSKSNKYEG